MFRVVFHKDLLLKNDLTLQAPTEKDRDEWENYLKEVEAYKEFKELLKSKKGLKNMDDDLIMMYDELGFFRRQARMEI